VRHARRFIDRNPRCVTGKIPLLRSGRVDPAACQISRADIAIAARPTRAVFAARSSGLGEPQVGTDLMPEDSEIVAIEPIIRVSLLHTVIAGPMTP